jgi:hypothetical protein
MAFRARNRLPGFVDDGLEMIEILIAQGKCNIKRND